MKELKSNAKIAIIGGDERQIYCGIYLADLGYEVALFGFEKYKDDIGLCTKVSSIEDAVSRAEMVVLPILNTQNVFCFHSTFSEQIIKLEDILKHRSGDLSVFAGRCNKDIRDLFEAESVKLYDYFEREELITANAYLTAESAVAVAAENTKFSLNGTSVLVMGYGRIGKMLCHLLKAGGACVFASARKRKDFEWIRAFGYSAVDTSKVCDVVSECKIIFNTIPNLVLGEDEMHCVPEDCLIIDLASKPGGVDFDAARKLGLRVIWALGLPGKCLPVSAGIVVAKTILNIIEDEVKVL